MSRRPEQSYRDTIEYLYALQKHGIKLALANSLALMKAMGDPHRMFRSIHIAGTNGKGSTSAFLASILAAAGYRVGLYTSPHLVSFTERIRINGRAITEEKVVELADRVRTGYAAGAASAGLTPTFFEVTTAIAFTYFAEEQVDVAVIEVGMGGRLDSTNVITPLVSVITNIDLEHTEFLGTTLELIAGEKAGIIKPGVPVVTGAVQPEVLQVIMAEAKSRQAPVYRLNHDFRGGNLRAGRESAFDYEGRMTPLPGLAVRMLGRHQVDNACLALAAVECLTEAGIPVNDHAVRTGLYEARWEGRLEQAGQGPDIYLDGAHNPASARTLAAALAELRKGYRKLILVLGILGDKDFRGIIAALVPLADRVIVTRPDYGRAMDLDLLAAEVRAVHPSVESAGTVGRAIEKARAGAEADDLVLITGSLYVVGDARAALVGGAACSQGMSSLKG